MVFDFSFVLVALALVTGVVWGVDSWLFARRRREAGIAKDPVAVDYARSFFPVIVIVLVLRSFLYEPFRIPSDSMMPTLVAGDFIFVNKWRYGPRLPVVNTRLFEVSHPGRGDVVVFRKPTDPGMVLIKRLVGLPGDVIRVTGGQLFVNGTPSRIEGGAMYTGPKSAQYPFTEVAEEHIGAVTHAILLVETRAGMEGEWRVPAGHYFMMGDNRNNSQDSRYPDVGYVPEANIIGKAEAIWLSLDPDHRWRLLWNRMGTAIH